MPLGFRCVVLMFKASISLLICSLAVPFIMESSVLKSPSSFIKLLLSSVLLMFAPCILDL